MSENLFGEVEEVKTLDLVITKFNLGELASNAQIVLATVKEKIKGYSADNYSEDNIDEAKRDKADLNAAAKKLNDVKIEYKKRWLKPFEDAFETPIVEAVNEIKTGSSRIDTVVRTVEDRAKEEKRKSLETFFNSLNCQYFTFDRIFNSQWLNKTFKAKDAEQEIKDKIAKVESDLAVLENVGEPDAKAYYLSTLDLNSALAEAGRIKKNREILAERERARVEAAPIVEAVRVDPVAPTVAAPTVETPKLYERRFVVRGTREQIVALGEYMNSNGIFYEKIEG